MKRVLFVCLALSNGGAERVVSVLSDSLMRAGMEIFILPLTDRKQAYSVDEKIHILKLEKQINGIAGKVNRIIGIRRSIKTHNIDTVIAFSNYNVMYSAIASIGLNVKVIGSERNDPAQEDGRRLFCWLRLMLYRRINGLVCQTEDARAYFPESIQRKSTVIPNPITDNLPEPYYGCRTHRVVSFSRLEPQKNIPMLINAFKAFHKDYPDYILELYGDGSLKDTLIKYVKDNKLENCVKIYPFVNDIHERVRDASMFALASDYEGLSNAMIEAMALGLPTIVTDCPCGGARMVIKDGKNGLLVPVGDATSMSEAMKKIASDADFSAELSENGIKIKDILKKEKIAKQWEEVIERC